MLKVGYMKERLKMKDKEYTSVVKLEFGWKNFEAKSKKDYIEIAKILNKYRYDEHMIILKLCKLFKKDNKLFNADKFIEACTK